MRYTYTPKGICPKTITLEIEKGTIQSAVFAGGCSGKLTALSVLVRGMRVEDVIKKLRGIRCKSMPSSCPDQLSYALEAALNAEK